MTVHALLRKLGTYARADFSRSAVIDLRTLCAHAREQADRMDAERTEANRDRATDPKLGDRTACKGCGLDIEYWETADHDWRDRGNNSACPDTGRPHQPVSDR